MLRDGRLDDLNAWLVKGFPCSAVGPFSAAIWQDGCFTPLIGNSNSPYPVACLQEPMIGALFCALVDEGVLSLDDPAGGYLPELFGHSDLVRISHLLSHSTGLWVDKQERGDNTPLAWSDFCELLMPVVPRFPPGRVCAPSLLDRILLLKVAERAIGQSPYAELTDRFFSSPNTIDLQPPGGSLARSFLEVHSSLAAYADFLNRATQTSWSDRLAGAMRDITQAPIVRPWAPVADALGLFRLANGILGQDGDHPRFGYVGLRLSPSCQTAVIGHFHSSVGRDHVLNRLTSDVMGIPPPPKSSVLGDLNAFDPMELPGTYQGVWGSQLHIDVKDNQLELSASREVRPFVAHIQPDGALTGRWAAPNLWIEPQSLGCNGLVGFRFAKHLYVKDKNHAHS